jgi:hypothetical protein
LDIVSILDLEVELISEEEVHGQDVTVEQVPYPVDDIVPLENVAFISCCFCSLKIRGNCH